MRVLADGRFLSKPQTGIGRVSSELARRAPDHDCEIAFLTTGPPNKAYAADNFSMHPNLAVCNHLPRLASLTRQVVRAADVFWGTSHRLPFALPSDLPCVLSVHDMVWKKYPETMRWRTWLGERLLFSHAVHRANAIVCLSRSTAADVVHYFPETEDKISVVYPGASPAQAERSPIEKPFALFVGTLEPRKNLAVLIAAFADLPTRVKDHLDLVIAGGDGWGGIDIKNIIVSHGLSSHIRVVKSPNDATLHQLYADCSFLVMPSLYEGFGLPIAEVMRYAKPVITSNTASMPEVAGEAGLLINPNEKSSITEAIIQLIENKALYKDLKGKARSQANQFCWDSYAQDMIGVMSTVIKTKK